MLFFGFRCFLDGEAELADHLSGVKSKVTVTVSHQSGFLECESVGLRFDETGIGPDVEDFGDKTCRGCRAM